MNLLIAGDSYAACDSQLRQDWPNLMAEKFNYKIENISGPGTSLYWTYKYLNYVSPSFDRFDRIIVIVTQSSRITINDQYNRQLNYLVDPVCTGLTSVERLLKKTEKNSQKYQKLLAAKFYFEYFQDFDTGCNTEIILHNALIDKIVKIVTKNKLILLKAFSLNAMNHDLFNSNLVFYDVNQMELDDIYGKTLHKIPNTAKVNIQFKEIWRAHMNHLIIENRLLIANHIHEIITDQTDKRFFNFDYSKVIRIKLEELSKYYAI